MATINPPYGKGRKENPAGCFLCGKTMTPTNEKNFVHLLTSGDLTDQKEAAESQGFFPIGGECKRKLPKGYVFRW